VDLYTLSPTFLPKDPIDEYVSAIWTERYSSAGEVQLVVPATLDLVDKLTPGTFLALRGTKEVMRLHTQSIEERLMTVVGSTLVEFLNERIVWFKNPAYSPSEEGSPKIVDYTLDVPNAKTPGEFIAHVVDKMVITPVPIPGTDFDTEANLDWPFEAIEHLELGPIDTSGEAKRLTIPTGPLYNGIEHLAKEAGLGISLYLDSATIDTGYVLKFTTYKGKDRSTGGTDPLVRLLPDMDTLSDVKEIRSNAGYKNVVYVWYKGELSTHYAEPTLPKPEGFDRHVMVTDAEGEPVGRKVTYTHFSPNLGSWTQIVVGPGEIAAFREQNAKDALANHNYIRAIDGQTSPAGEYKYGVDYGLGDIIELAGITGLIVKARVTEYIRTQDKNGEREYPTISVIS
jgi:Siphovirus ReqiPepy6 Gp37-like protein